MGVRYSAPATTIEVETAQDAALGNATALNPAVARSDPTVDLSVQSAAAQAGLSGASLNAGVVIASEGGNTAQLDALGVVTANAQEIDLKTLPERVVLKTATGNLTAAECTNTEISNYGQSAEATHTLPTAGPGMFFRATIATTGHAVHYKAGPNDKIYLDGTALDDGDKVSVATPALGNWAFFASMVTGDGTYDWSCIPMSGSWVDGGA